MLVLRDRIKQSSSNYDEYGNIYFDDTVFEGFNTFEVIGDDNNTYYTIVNNGNFEVGIAKYFDVPGGTGQPRFKGLFREGGVVLDSSNNGDPIQLQGVSIVFCTYPATKSVVLDENNFVTDTIPEHNQESEEHIKVKGIKFDGSDLIQYEPYVEFRTAVPVSSRNIFADATLQIQHSQPAAPIITNQGQDLFSQGSEWYLMFTVPDPGSAPITSYIVRFDDQPLPNSEFRVVMTDIQNNIGAILITDDGDGYFSNVFDVSVTLVAVNRFGAGPRSAPVILNPSDIYGSKSETSETQTFSEIIAGDSPNNIFLNSRDKVFVYCDNNDVNLFLPLGNYPSDEITIKRVSGENKVKIIAPPNSTIDLKPEIEIFHNLESVTLVSDGIANWFII